MAKQKLKRVQAGQLVREVLWTPAFPSDPPKTRAEKSRCSTKARQRINDRYSWQKLKTVLAANFNDKDLVLTLTYDDEHLPRNRNEAKKQARIFLAQLREYRRAHGEDLRYVYCTESRHGDGRLHHHMVINGTGSDYEAIRSLWTHGSNLQIDTLDIYGYEELAKYLTKEAREGCRAMIGERTWIGSRNLYKPETPPSEWVPGNIRLEPPANAHVLYKESIENSWGRFAYVEYMLPSAPSNVRTRPRKRKTK